MTYKAGERLFEAIGSIPEELILEAEWDSLQEQTDQTLEKSRIPKQNGKENEENKLNKEALQKENERKVKAAVLQEENREQAAARQEKTAVPCERDGEKEHAEESTALTAERQKSSGHSDRKDSGQNKNNRILLENIGGVLKYLPAAACLCLVFCGAFYIVSSFIRADDAANYSMSEAGSADMLDTESLEIGVEDNGKGGQQEKSEEQSPQANENSQPFMPKEPLRFDDYEGPVMAMTATGDTQKIRTGRTIKSTIVSDDHDGVMYPRLCIEDCYRIRNTSKKDKTLQLVYPFAAVMNPGSAAGERFLEISGQEEPEVFYNIGESIRFYWGQEQDAMTSAGDYWRLFEDGQEYQEHALEKEADWNREVWVYTFTGPDTQEDAAGNDEGVIGVTVNGADAEVLTYGFDYSAQRTEETADYCFFDGERNQQRYLIITGGKEESPQMNYYANLDCVEETEDLKYHMQEEKMSYADALRLCIRAAVKQITQDYEQGVYDGSQPEYLDVDAVYKALTIISEEENFYDQLVQQYGSAELRDIFEKLLGETRVIYALSTVTIPAGKTVQVTVRTQKRQTGEYTYDYLPDSRSHLNIKKTVCTLVLPDEWQISKQNMNLKRQKSVWRAVLNEKLYHFTITECFESDTFRNKD